MTDTTTLFRFHWPDGHTREGRGIDLADALKNSGGGALSERTFDYYEIIEESYSAQKRDEMLKAAYK